MNRRRLGDSDLEVSEISLGSWLTYGGGVEREQTEACTRAAFDAGINFFDTANVYGAGAAEEAWGEILSDFDRDSYVLATKVFFPMSETDRGPLARADPQADRRLARRACRPTTSTSTSATAPTRRSPIEETMEALTEVVRGGQGPRRSASREWTPEQIRAGPRGARRGEVRLLPAAVQHDLAGARGRADPALRRARDLADRLVAARPGRAHRQVRARRAAARGLPRRQRRDGLGDGPLHGRRGARGGPAPASRSPRTPGSTMVQLALAWVLRRDERRLGDHRRLAARAGPRQRRGLRGRALATTRSTRSTRRSPASRSPNRSRERAGRQAPLATVTQPRVRADSSTGVGEARRSQCRPRSAGRPSAGRPAAPIAA